MFRRRLRMTVVILGVLALLVVGFVALDYLTTRYTYYDRVFSQNEFLKFAEEVDTLHCAQHNSGLPLLPDFVCFDTNEEVQAFLAQSAAEN